MSDPVVLSRKKSFFTPRSPSAFPRKPWVSTLILLVICLLLWEGSKLLFGISDQKLPHIHSIIMAFFDRPRGANGPLRLMILLNSALYTFGEAIAGFVLGALLGCMLAIVFASSKLLERSLLPFVVGSQTVPILAIAPMVVVGLGQLNAPAWFAKAVVAAYLTFFPVTIGMLRGLRSVHPDALNLMSSYAASPWQTFYLLRFPVALPHLFTALKIAATSSVIGALVAELPAGSQYGIGVEIIKAAQFYNANPPLLFATIFISGLIGLIFYGCVVVAERLIVRERRAE